jgi:uncharacterized protein YndB with AHSA1/START domain
MAHRFEITQDLEVGATPEQVWEAIATGRGMDSWFMGQSEVEPREGGRARWSIGGYTEDSTVSTWDPPRRFVNTGTEGPDGSFHRFDYRIEDRGSGRTTIRYVHSGMLGGDWEAEYEGMSEGDPMYLHKLVEYLTYFSGRFATGIDAQGPTVADREHAMSVFRRGLGMGDDAADGDQVRLSPEGFEPIEGVVDHVSPSFLGVRSNDALYRFIYGFDGSVMVGHHLFADGVDQEAARLAWQRWLERLFGPSAGDGTTSD